MTPNLDIPLGLGLWLVSVIIFHFREDQATRDNAALGVILGGTLMLVGGLELLIGFLLRSQPCP